MGVEVGWEFEEIKIKIFENLNFWILLKVFTALVPETTAISNFIPLQNISQIVFK